MKDLSRLIIAGIAAIAASLMLTACGGLTDDTIAVEAKCYGLNLEVPSTTSGQSIGKVQLGVVTTRYIQAPKGGKASINSEYDDVNIWTLSGTVKSSLSAETPINSGSTNTTVLPSSGTTTTPGTVVSPLGVFQTVPAVGVTNTTSTK